MGILRSGCRRLADDPPGQPGRKHRTCRTVHVAPGRRRTTTAGASATSAEGDTDTDLDGVARHFDAGEERRHPRPPSSGAGDERACGTALRVALVFT